MLQVTHHQELVDEALKVTTVETSRKKKQA